MNGKRFKVVLFDHLAMNPLVIKQSETYSIAEKKDIGFGSELDKR